jgi:transposase InsO family protein
MAELGIAGKAGVRKVRTTWRDPKAKLAAGLVGRDFHPGRPDRLWVGDMTYVPTDEGFVYVSSVLDAHTRRLLGWSITDHMRAEACCDALRAAVATRGRVRLDGVVFHSDHGSQYTSDDYRLLLSDLHVTQSMGTVGDSYDNAMAESFWASLKRELVDDAHYRTKEEAWTAIFEWLVWYRRERLHSSIGYPATRGVRPSAHGAGSSVGPCPLHGRMFSPWWCSTVVRVRRRCWGWTGSWWACGWWRRASGGCRCRRLRTGWVARGAGHGRSGTGGGM